MNAALRVRQFLNATIAISGPVYGFRRCRETSLYGFSILQAHGYLRHRVRKAAGPRQRHLVHRAPIVFSQSWFSAPLRLSIPGVLVCSSTRIGIASVRLRMTVEMGPDRHWPAPRRDLPMSSEAAVASPVRENSSLSKVRSCPGVWLTSSAKTGSVDPTLNSSQKKIARICTVPTPSAVRISSRKSVRSTPPPVPFIGRPFCRSHQRYRTSR